MISIFDTTVCDNNLGNQIIMDSVNKYLHQIFPSDFFIKLPYLDNIGDEAIKYIRESKYIFLGGTNALSSEMENYKQIGIDHNNYNQIKNIILTGVGWWQYQGAISDCTREILNNCLHTNLYHSVRDSYTKNKLSTIGINNVLVTGCPTLWQLTEKHCQQIKKDKSENVLLTFTNYSQDKSDLELLNILKSSYKNIFVWIQGPEDLEYARNFGTKLNILPPNLESLDKLLCSDIDLDYIGTRCHAGIRAMQFMRRSIIIGVDNRAIEMQKDFNLPVVLRTDLSTLPEIINSKFETRLNLPFDKIRQWIGQFQKNNNNLITDELFNNGTKKHSSLKPLSKVFGFDRGKPIDRYYIEKFLNENRHLIQGRVLEIADNSYTKQYGSAVTQSDVLNAVPSPKATIIGDLITGENIPEDAYDCIILTQTLHVVYNIRAAIQNAVKALKPNGVLLLTAPGISQISRYDMDRWGDYWRFTDKSLKMLLAETMPQEAIYIKSYGNVAVAKAFLDGQALHELSKDVLDYNDNDYQVLLTARVLKSGSEISIRNTPQTDKILTLSRDRSLAADFWSKVDCSESDKNFYCFSPIRTRSSKLIFDEFDASKTDWCEYWTVQKYLKDQIPFEKCISVCCGTGQIERTLAKLNVAKKIIGIDIAQGAIEKAKQRARDENLNNIEYYVSDLNTESLKEDEYDIIWANGALHHIENLDSVIPMLYKSLKRGGFLISNEYVGPKYQQIPQRQQEIINAVKHIMPPELRLKSQIEKYDTFGQIWKHTPMKYFLETDPSECINSNNIIPLLRKYFEDVEVKYFDGSILFYLLDSTFYDNFDIKNQNHRRLLEMLFNIEDTLIETGEIARDNAHIICNKKSKASLIQWENSDNCILNQSYISKANSFETPLILLYHRVADDPIDSQLLTVSPENFEAHLKELAENYRVLPLHQLLEEACKNQLEPNTLAITFDDGYLDNLNNAVPLLEKYGLHATIFVVSGMVGSQSEFWWDALERIFLTGHPLPSLLNIQDSQGILEWDLTTAQNRLKAYDELCEMLRALPSAKIDEIVNQLLNWAGLTRIGRSTHQIVDAQQLKLLASSASIEIGSHSITHTRLSSLSPQEQQYEIAKSKQQIESIIEKPVRLFSYPYGSLEDITKETGRILAGTGYDAGIANVQGSLVSPVDMYAVPRRLVRNWSGPTFAQWLKDGNKTNLEAQTLSDRVQRIISSSFLPWSKQKQNSQIASL
jgi:peptidoglycan/xylan/chitin deacetylase (PgdA/CDA1 family)/2-polyprenyl-3-methyl-5-hydroxy-6-metoxy-1,4-benzoquinol methylase